eukprot:758537-Hanusia_phi.AAC.3
MRNLSTPVTAARLPSAHVGTDCYIVRILNEVETSEERLGGKEPMTLLTVRSLLHSSRSVHHETQIEQRKHITKCP